MKKFGKLMLLLCTASLLAVGMTAFAACDDSDSATDDGSGSIVDEETGGNESQNAQSVAGKLYTLTDITATGSYEGWVDEMKGTMVSGNRTYSYAFGTDGSFYITMVTQEASVKGYSGSYVQNGNEIIITYPEGTEANMETSITVTDAGIDISGYDDDGSFTYHCTYSGAFDPDAYEEMDLDT